MREILVRYHWEPEGCWAESPDIEGFVAAGTDIAEVRALVREGLAYYLEGETVEILEATTAGAPISELHMQEGPAFVAVSSVATSLVKFGATTSTISAPFAWRAPMSNEPASCPA